MIEKHPSEADLQQFALVPGESKPKIVEHIGLCKRCKAEIANYQLLFLQIKEQEKPVFDFVLTDLVLTQINPITKSLLWDKLLIYLISFVAILLTGIGFYIFRKYFSDLFASVAQLFLYLLITTAISILVFQLIDIFKQYQKKFHALDFY